MTTPVFHTIEEAYRYCRDMDASLRERLDTFSAAARRLRPTMQQAVDRLVVRLMASDIGAGAPRIGDYMPPFVLPDERGELVSLEGLLKVGPAAITFHRGHWCPYCRINTKALAEAQKVGLEKLSLADLRSIHDGITDDVFSVLSVQNSVKSRTSFGGTAPSEVKKQIRYWRKRLAKA